MALYLQLDGVDDYLKLPSMTFTEIIFDAITNPSMTTSNLYVDARPAIGFTYLQNLSNGNDDFSGFTLYVNGTQKSNGTVAIPKGQRNTIRLTRSAGTSALTFFSHNSGTSGRMRADVFDIKIYNGATLQAHYDMSTGNVNDISGNGNHATLTGGTFVDDGTGGGGTGTAGSISYSTKNIIYRTASNNYDSKQQLFTTSSQQHDTKQTIYSTQSRTFNTKIVQYRNGSENYDSKQTIYNSSLLNYDLKQNIYNNANVNYSTKQSIYNTTSTLFDTLQQVLDSGIVGSLSYLTKQVLSCQSVNEYQTKQSLYRSDRIDLDTLQQLLSDWNTYKEVYKITLNITINQTLDLSITTQRSASLAITQNKQMDLNI